MRAGELKKGAVFSVDPSNTHRLNGAAPASAHLKVCDEARSGSIRVVEVIKQGECWNPIKKARRFPLNVDVLVNVVVRPEAAPQSAAA